MAHGTRYTWRKILSGLVVMAQSSKSTEKKGPKIAREVTTGRFISVESSEGVQKRRPKTIATIKEASSLRSAALKRLANR